MPAAPHRFRQILKKIVDTKEGMGKKMRDSSFALTEAKYAAGEFRHTVFDSVETVCTIRVVLISIPSHDVSQHPLQAKACAQSLGQVSPLVMLCQACLW